MDIGGSALQVLDDVGGRSSLLMFSGSAANICKPYGAGNWIFFYEIGSLSGIRGPHVQPKLTSWTSGGWIAVNLLSPGNTSISRWI